MTGDLPKFDSPPVIETVLSAQFARLPGFSSALAGWFWRKHLGDEWPEVKEAAPIADQFERFGKDRQFRTSAPALVIGTGQVPQRLQITHSTSNKMIQIQDSRFTYNWRRRPEDTTYPGYEELLAEFLLYFESFDQFCNASCKKHVDPNQWEITYFNNLQREDVWRTFEDWSKVIPSFQWPPAEPHSQPDGFQGEWLFVLGDNLGRLRVSLAHARIGSESGTESMLLQLTARGPIQPDKGIDLKTGLNIGHEAIVRSFAAMTSAACHDRWKRIK